MSFKTVVRFIQYYLNYYYYYYYYNTNFTNAK